MCGAPGCILHAHHDEDHTDGTRRWARSTTHRGTTNRDDRGNAATRRARKTWLLNTFGDRETCPCYRCGRSLSRSLVEADRIIPGCLGGSYRRSNIRPVCEECNKITGNAVKAMIRDRVRKPTIIRLCKQGLI